ncbi:MFS transporter [Lacisediminihabitans profunda]|uniref:MFS transporter n=1 Tax=Lacisediminihabitans profunda TaxID=2594790 RepID=A0A5C8USJ8_9MICO|nr:MFS transporter [Lacisediminihabitans profunda]TXN30903.1 MFS transporter [Lacisediminihabitans profunda]
MLKPDERTTPRNGWAIDLAPLRGNPAYARLWAGGVTSGIGAQLTVVAIGVQIYDLTKSTFAVSLVGIISFAPMIVVGTFGSSLVDAFDRRIVLLCAALTSWVAVGGIAAFAWVGGNNLTPLYVLATLSSVSSTIVGTARFSILPRLVPASQLPAAAALSGVSAGLQVTFGPALAGLLIAGCGFAWTYSIDVILYTTAFLGIVMLPPIRPEGKRMSLGSRSVLDGIHFLATSPALRAPILLHVVCMVFGRPQALYPALAATVLGGGPMVVGLLSSSAAIGVLASSVFSGRLVRIRRQGVVVGLAATSFGASILAVGIVIASAGRDARGTEIVAVPLIAACVLLFFSGASDNVASIFRTTMMQSAAPDAVRGRIQGLTTVVLTAGPRVGDAWVGALSGFSFWAAPVVGGAIIVLAAAATTRWARGMREYVPVEVPQ